MLSPLALLLIKSMPINIDDINKKIRKREKIFEIFAFPEFIFRSPLNALALNRLHPQEYPQ